ncbi:UNVERIFIED_CONTAM: hypothetical protein PYX00_000286 [Menopon gallinae]|uniref:TIMELESS-interacting protein n=1 Tax=Menopon gallinae TaxID=328185 RepID=A0AAW2I9P2_9NEOP
MSSEKDHDSEMEEDDHHLPSSYVYEGQPDSVDKDFEDSTDLKTGSQYQSEKKKRARNTGPALNIERLQSQRGLPSLVEMADKFTFKGKNREIEDLTALKCCLQHWMCNELYPRYDEWRCMKELEKLGKKKVVQKYMRNLRMDSVRRYMYPDYDSDSPLVDNIDISDLFKS